MTGTSEANPVRIFATFFRKQDSSSRFSVFDTRTTILDHHPPTTTTKHLQKILVDRKRHHTMAGEEDITTITHTASGASAKIHAVGATVVSFRSSPCGREHLFVSRQAKLDGSKAIRGGIPICFPIFGPPSGESTMPQHVSRSHCYRRHPSSSSSRSRKMLRLLCVTTRWPTIMDRCGLASVDVVVESFLACFRISR